MNETALPTGKNESLSPVWRFVSIVAVFLLVWPPICGIAVWCVVFGSNSMKFLFGGIAFVFSAKTSIFGWVTLIVVYVFWGSSALLAGVVHAVAAIGFRYNSAVVPLAAAFGATIWLVAKFLRPVPLERVVVAMDSGFVLSFSVLLMASLIASLICWRLTRRFARTQ